MKYSHGGLLQKHLVVVMQSLSIVCGLYSKMMCVIWTLV